MPNEILSQAHKFVTQAEVCCARAEWQNAADCFAKCADLYEQASNQSSDTAAHSSLLVLARTYRTRCTSLRTRRSIPNANASRTPSLEDALASFTVTRYPTASTFLQEHPPQADDLITRHDDRDRASADNDSLDDDPSLLGLDTMDAADNVWGTVFNAMKVLPKVQRTQQPQPALSQMPGAASLARMPPPPPAHSIYGAQFNGGSFMIVRPPDSQSVMQVASIYAHPHPLLASPTQQLARVPPPPPASTTMPSALAQQGVLPGAYAQPPLQQPRQPHWSTSTALLQQQQQQQQQWAQQPTVAPPPDASVVLTAPPVDTSHLSREELVQENTGLRRRTEFLETQVRMLMTQKGEPQQRDLAQENQELMLGIAAFRKTVRLQLEQSRSTRSTMMGATGASLAPHGSAFPMGQEEIGRLRRELEAAKSKIAELSAQNEKLLVQNEKLKGDKKKWASVLRATRPSSQTLESQGGPDSANVSFDT